MPTKAEVIQKLQAIAKDFDNKDGNVNRGDSIRDLIQELNTGKRDHNTIEIRARVKLEKFDGEWFNGKQPVEVREFLTEL